MSDITVTAIVDTYNQGRFIADALRSVLAQDFPAGQMEVLVVDDGSTDNTREIVAGFGSRVRYLRKPNGGQASALNMGLTEARGEIVALLDADDLWLPGKIRRVTAAFQAHPEAGMVYHPLENWDQERNIRWTDPEFQPLSGFIPAMPGALLKFGGVSTSAMSFRRRHLNRLLPVPEELKILADSYLGYLAIFVAEVVAVPECLTQYRQHDGNLFTITADDQERLRRRWVCAHAAVRSVRTWLASNRQDLEQYDLAAFLARAELWEEAMRFRWRGARRAELLAHLRKEYAVFGQHWSRRYRVFKGLSALLGIALGYKTYQGLRDARSKRAMSGRLRPLPPAAMQPEPLGLAPLEQ